MMTFCGALILAAEVFLLEWAAVTIGRACTLSWASRGKRHRRIRTMTRNYDRRSMFRLVAHTDAILAEITIPAEMRMPTHALIRKSRCAIGNASMVHAEIPNLALVVQLCTPTARATPRVCFDLPILTVRHPVFIAHLAVATRNPINIT